ncbi:hypothetical protein [Acetobacter persici]|uniref:hypothetical protein n=1 Tax=Acetobacter persici TaxID=1076596 RepID=UPI001BA614A2|nr:hypothetical protein [Acetobacter persici]MBS1016759.1 hypothetical protein [Acetobacter persici]
MTRPSKAWERLAKNDDPTEQTSKLGQTLMTAGKKATLIILLAFALSGCKNFYHSSCPGFSGENPEARDGIKSVIQTCN